MGNKALIVGSVAVFTLALAFVAYDYSRTSDANYKKNVRSKRKAMAKKNQERVKMAEQGLKNSQSTGSKAAAVPPADKARNEYTIEQSTLAQKCLQEGDVEGAIQHYANVVFQQENPIEFLSALRAYLPEQLILAIAQKVFPDNYFDTFPVKEVVGFEIKTDDMTAKRTCLAVKSFAKGDKIMTCEPFASHLYSTVDVKDYCFTCKKHLEGCVDKVGCEHGCIFSYCSMACKDNTTVHKTFCVKEEEIDHPMFALMKLSSETGRTIFWAVAEMLTLILNTTTETRTVLMEDLSHLYLPQPIPRASELTRKECELMLKWVGIITDVQVLDDTGYIALLCKTMYNAVEFQTQPQQLNNINSFKSTGKAIFLNAAYFNHSCVPNVISRSDVGTNKVSFYANADIKVGEELFVSYVDINSPYADRQEVLKTVYDFTCKCQKCEIEDPTSSFIAAAVVAADTDPTPVESADVSGNNDELIDNVVFEPKSNEDSESSEPSTVDSAGAQN